MLQPYFQPNPSPPAPFILNSAFHDPAVGPGAAWALNVANSKEILVYGASSEPLHTLASEYRANCIRRG